MAACAAARHEDQVAVPVVEDLGGKRPASERDRGRYRVRRSAGGVERLGQRAAPADVPEAAGEPAERGGEGGRFDAAPDGQAPARVGPAAGDEQRQRLGVALDVVVRGSVAGGAVGVREGERRAQRALVVGSLGGEARALEDELAGREVGLRLDAHAERPEQLARGVEPHDGAVPRAQQVAELVRLGEAPPRPRLRALDEQRALLEPQRAEHARLRRQRDALAHAERLAEGVERRRQHAREPGVPQGVRAQALDPRAREPRDVRLGAAPRGCEAGAVIPRAAAAARRCSAAPRPARRA